MVRFENEDKLAEFLESCEPGYGAHAAKLWARGIRSTAKLANIPPDRVAQILAAPSEPEDSHKDDAYDLIGRANKKEAEEGGARTGGGGGGAVGAAEQQVIRAKFASRYIGVDRDSTPVTILQPGWLVTYAHGSHGTWTVGAEVEVWLNDEGRDQRRRIKAKVAFTTGCPTSGRAACVDYVLLRVADDDLTPDACPVLDTAVNPGAQYVLVGASARSQRKDPSSVRHGSVLSTFPDENLHIRGDTPPEEGDSGGGCFLVSTGALFAICLARSSSSPLSTPSGAPRPPGQQASLLHIMVPLAQVERLMQAQGVGG